LSIDDATVKTKDVEKHPERRFKGALAAFEERELPNFKKDNPGLRLTQLKEIMYKAFQKSPENPFNQVNVVAYNVTQEEAHAMKCKYFERVFFLCIERVLLTVDLRFYSQQEQGY
jgi:hypothetical protein